MRNRRDRHARVAGVLAVTASMLVTTATGAQAPPELPAWTTALAVRTLGAVRATTSDHALAAGVEAAAADGANAVLLELPDDDLLAAFIEDAGFAAVRARIESVAALAAARGLRTIVDVHGLGVITPDAVDPFSCARRPAETLALSRPGWLQLDLDGEPVLFTCVEHEHVTGDMEDAWISPFSPYRQLLHQRIAQLGAAGVDAVAAVGPLMPGLQPPPHAPVWGTTDPAAVAAFESATGRLTPWEPLWDDPDWHAWLGWRHEASRHYLAELADAALAAGVVPLWRNPTADTPSTALTGAAVPSGLPLGQVVPLIPQDDDWLAALRTARFARDAAPDAPLLLAGRPRTERDAGLEAAIALAVTGNLVLEASAPYPADLLAFAARIRPLLDRRTPHWGRIALVVSSRNLDGTYPTGDHFAAYDQAFRDLVQADLPFRIVVLEELTAEALSQVDGVVLPHVPALSDAEHALLRDKEVVTRGEVGTRNADWSPRGRVLTWPRWRGSDVTVLHHDLDVAIDPPWSASLTYWDDGDGGLLLVLVDPAPGGRLRLVRDAGLEVAVHAPGRATVQLEGGAVTVDVLDHLTVVHVAPSPARTPRPAPRLERLVP